MAGINGPERKPWLSGRCESLFVDTNLKCANLSAGGGVIENLLVSEALDIGDDPNVRGNLRVAGSSTLTGDVRAVNNLGVSRELDVGGQAIIRGNFRALGAEARIAGNLAIVGNVTTDILAQKDVFVGQDLGVQGAATFDNSIRVKGLDYLISLMFCLIFLSKF